jgi:hypothetical protein
MKPVSQVYSLILESLDGHVRPRNYWRSKREELMVRWANNEDKVADKLQESRETEAENILFHPLLKKLELRERDALHKSQGIQKIDKFFKRFPAPVVVC